MYLPKIYNRDILLVNMKLICHYKLYFLRYRYNNSPFERSSEDIHTKDCTRELESAAIFNTLPLTSDNLSVRRVEIMKNDSFSPGEKTASSQFQRYNRKYCAAREKHRFQQTHQFTRIDIAFAPIDCDVI